MGGSLYSPIRSVSIDERQALAQKRPTISPPGSKLSVPDDRLLAPGKPGDPCRVCLTGLPGRASQRVTRTKAVPRCGVITTAVWIGGRKRSWRCDGFDPGLVSSGRMSRLGSSPLPAVDGHSRLSSCLLWSRRSHLDPCSPRMTVCSHSHHVSNPLAASPSTPLTAS